MRQHRVFVYGTLMRGEVGHHHVGHCRFEGPARTPPRFELVDVGGYPGLVARGSRVVRGEVYSIDEGTIPTVDEYEDVPEQYLREPIELADGTIAEAYLLHTEIAARCPVIASGDWRHR